jgi:hypothetical protein
LAGLLHDELTARAVEISMEDSICAWSSVQALLTAVANISKALWGQGGKLGQQRKPLRDSLGVADSSPLRPTSMRNNFDHFDDRLDTWWHASARDDYVDLSIGDVASAISGVPEEEMFRSYDPATGDVVFWGKRYNLPLIVDELKRIAPVALRSANSIAEGLTALQCPQSARGRGSHMRRLRHSRSALSPCRNDRLRAEAPVERSLGGPRLERSVPCQPLGS